MDWFLHWGEEEHQGGPIACKIPKRKNKPKSEYIARALWQEENHKLSFNLEQISTMNKQHEKEND